MKRAILLAVLLVACGSAQHATAPTIDDIRARAAERPDDPAAQRDLAEAELLMRGGDPARARAAIANARRLSPRALDLALLDATEHEIHGQLSEALDGYLEVVELARRSDDPRAYAFAQVAAAEVEGLDDAVSDYPSRVQTAFSSLHADAGGIGDGARATVADQLIDLAYRRGDVDEAREIAERQRCVTEWRVAGPFGPRHLLGFEQRLPPDAGDALEARYELGPSRGERDTRTVHGRGCNVHIGSGPVAGPGTTFAEATLEVPEAGRWVIRLETPNSVQLFVDGEPVAQIARHREPTGRTSYHAVQLDAGAHRLRVRVTTRHPNPVLHVSASRTPGEPGGAPIEGDGLTTTFLRAQLHMARGDVVHAREIVRPLLNSDGGVPMLLVGAAAALNDPLRSSEVRHDGARRLLGWAAARDEAAWFPRLTLAQLEATEGRDVAAMDLLRDSSERWPDVIAFPLSRIDLLVARGWRAQVDEAIQRASVIESACRPRRAALERDRRRHHAEAAMASARRVVECDARSDALLTLFVHRREWERALEQLERLAAYEPEERGLGELRVRFEVARSRGDDAAMERLIAEMREHVPLGDELVLATADRQLAAGDADDARQTLRGALEREPEAMMGARRALWAMGGEMPLEGFRRDGAEVIRGLEESGRTYEEPMVLVFDYTVYRVFEDGSMLELTHNIFRLQSQEAVDAMGEYSVPEGAHMLTLHTVKADGRRLEPDEIAGKDTISFPSLAPGDYIEFEYLRGHGSPAGYPRGFVGDRFYFRNYETPFDLSELTVVVPESMELTIDPRGAAPETQIETRDGLRVYRWSVQESRPFSQEPGSIASREFFPSIAWGRNASWEQYVETLRDVLADRDARDPAAARLVREVVGRARSPEDKARRIYRWVLDHVEDSQDVFGSAPAMVAARTGNRTRVYRYLLEMAGIDAELALVRSFASDRTEGTLPDDDTYQNLVVRLRTGDGWTFTHAGARGAPFGYLPPQLDGMDALLLGEEGGRITLPERGLEAHRREVEADIELREDGSARVSVVETFHGSGAVMWRNQLEEIPDARLEDQFESGYVANVLPGAELTRLVITGREEPDEPLVMRYEAEVSGLARRAGDALVVPPLFEANLGRSLAAVASREIPQIIANGFAYDATVRLRLPDDTTATGASPVELEALGATVRVAVERGDESIDLRRRVRIPRMRVTPEQYPTLARFARAADEAEGAELRVVPD